MKIFARIIKSDFYSNFLKKSGFLVAATALCAAAVFSSPAFAEAGANLTFTVNVPSDSLLEIKLFNADGTEMGNNTSMNVVPSMSAAGFNEKEVVVSVGTNNEWGYNLMMNVDNTSLVSSSDSSKTIPSLAERDTAYTCTPETADTCDFTLNSWGLKIKDATASQPATNGYMAIPSSIELNKNTTTTNGDPTHILFGSKINAQQAPGAYSTTINFVATANPVPKYTVTLNTDGHGTVSSNSVQVEHGTTAPTGSSNPLSLGGTSITATPSTGYNFSSWTSNCGAEITGACTVTANFEKLPVFESYHMQGFSCSSLSSGSTTTLTDYRDSATYTIRNINGTCWMTQNLRFTWDSNTTLSPYTTNVSTETKITVEDLSLGNEYTKARIKYSGDTSYGTYYNYCAASAGTVCNDTETKDATSDICPKGWRLPTQSEITTIKNNSGSNWNAVSAGNYDGGSVRNAGRYGNGFWWSATAYDAAYQCILRYDSFEGTGNVNYYNKYYGYSMRCVAQ